MRVIVGVDGAGRTRRPTVSSPQLAELDEAVAAHGTIERLAPLDQACVAEVVGDSPKVCARIANNKHALVPDDGDGYGTGNCTPIER